MTQQQTVIKELLDRLFEDKKTVESLSLAFGGSAGNGYSNIIEAWQNLCLHEEIDEVTNVCKICRKEMKVESLTCPDCSSHNVCQYRSMVGPIWCGDCGFRAEEKEKDNPFAI